MARSSPSRRALLAGAAVLAVPVAASANSAVAPAFVNLANPDAPLIALATEFIDLERHCEALPSPTTLEAERVYDAAVAPIRQRQDDLVFDMLDLPPASTLAGHQAVARALDAYADPSDYGADHDTAEQLVGLLLAGLAGREQTAGRRGLPAPIGTVPALPPHPDARLIAACAAIVAHERQSTISYFARMEEAETVAEGERHEAKCAIHADNVQNLRTTQDMLLQASKLPATTPAGVRAKAEVVKVWLGVLNKLDEDTGEYVFFGHGSNQSVFAWSLVQDLLGTGGAT